VTAGRLDEEQTVAERVSFAKAKAALEQYAQQHADRIFGVEIGPHIHE